MNKKTALFKSAISLILCFAMLAGSTYAWFTDSATSTSNIIKSGTLNVEMYWTDDLNGTWYNVEESGYNTIFSYDNWEPGYTDVKYIKIVNTGNLAMNYKLTLAPQGAVGKLAEVINVYFANEAVALQSRDDLSQLNAIGLLSNVVNGGETADGTLLPADQYSPLHPSGEVVMTIAMSMITTAGNDYQNQNSGEFTITALATQAAFESDSFDNTYDGSAEFPALLVGGTVSVPVAAEDGKIPAGGVTMNGNGISAYVPGGIQMADGAEKLTLSVTPMEHTTTDITTVNNEILIPVDVHIEGIAAGNTTPIVIDLGQVLPKYLNMGNYRLYHVENGVNSVMTLVDSAADLTVHNSFTYDPLTGEVSVAMATFSEVALLADTTADWKGTIATAFSGGTGTEEDPYLIANADQFAYFNECISNDNGEYGNAHYRLLGDLNLGGDKQIFYPIGYHKVGGAIATIALDEAPEAIYEINEETKLPVSSVADETEVWYTYGGSFGGTFDGNGHKISNIYQNTWALKGDYDGHYWNDAMGLFGYVYGGTIKNLTVDSFESDGEFTPTGVIAAYAAGNATFENIAITNCNPRVYNTGNGGIIGIAGSTSAADDDHITLKNITVDNTNIISALWGSYDVACGGLVGMYRGNVDGSGNATGDTISFDNCHVAAQMDVYNDVCGNYQYYWYRYSGMIIGSIRHNKTVGNYVQPDMTGITANGCTVHFGEWNNYYYCEFEKNGHPSYSGPDDYKFSRVDDSELVIEDGKITGCTHNHTDVENNRAIYLPFDQLFTGYGWGVKSQGLKELEGIEILDITQGDQEESVVKFDTKFTGDFQYRVGNQNTVSVGSLFAAKDGATINNSGVVVTIDKVDENAQVSGVYTANADWTKGTIQFSGTGVVKVTIQDYNFCTPTVLYLEVVDAMNATSAISATANNVVLLKDCGFSSLEVSGGYTLYGNGFTMTCSSDSYALDMGYAFVNLNSGILDNVQIVTPNFDYAVLYKSNMTESGNRSYTDDAGKTRYYNVKSGVMATGNSQILNSRISGARAAVNVAGGNCVIDNSRIELGAVASILVGSANSLTLRDVTLVQKPTASTYDSSKTLMGFSVLFVCDANGNAAPVTLEGTLIQNAWVDETDKQYVPSAGQSIISTVLGKTEYLHDIDGDGTKESLNLGFAYMPESLTSKVNTTTITDNRTNKDGVPYDYAEVTILNGKTYVYSYKNTNGTDDKIKEEGTYTPDAYGDIIVVNYADSADGLIFDKSYGTDGWIYELNVDLDKLSGYALDFSKLSMTVNGVAVTDYKVNGSVKPVSPVAVTAGGTTYTLTATVNGKEYTAYFKVTGTETSKESPSKISGPTAPGFGVAKSYGSDWSGAADVLTGVKIKYWSVAENKYIEYDFSNFKVPGNAGKLNGTNNYWEYTHTQNDFTLKVTNTVAIHSGKSVYGMPILGTDGKLYFTISSTNGYVGSGTTSRSVTMQYEFTDNNGGEKLTFTHTFDIGYSKDEQYSYSDLSGSGVLTPLEAGSSSGCVAPETLITLANGKQVRVDSLKGDEMLLVWNMETGKYESAPIVFVDNDAETEYEIVHLYFSDGSDVKVIFEHGFFDLDLGKYVYIDAENYADYVGHKFVKQGDVHNGAWNVITLDKVVIENEITTAWSPVTFQHLCYYTNGVLSMPGGIEGLFNIFEVDTKTMTYDAELMQKDIESYGLLTLKDFDGMITEEAFVAFNGAYLNVAIGKGLLTWEEIAYMAERYIPLM